MSAAAAVAAHGLASEWVPGEIAADADFDALLGDCEDHRVLGLLGAAVGDGVIVLDDGQRTLLEERLATWLAHDLRLERLVVDAVGCLREGGIPSRVLKGVALAHTAYPDPAQRVFGDVDVLVPGDRILDAVDVITRELGGVRAMPELRPGFDVRFGKEAMVRCRGLELDLHRTFVDGALGVTLDRDSLFTTPRTLELGGVVVDVLGPAGAFLHACYAAALGDWPPRLASLRDVAQLLVSNPVPAPDLIAMAARSRARAVVAGAVTSSWRELRLRDRPPLLDWARAYRPTRAERALLASQLGPARAYTRQLAASVVIPGLRAKASYLRAIAFPQREYLDARRLNTRSHAGARAPPAPPLAVHRTRARSALKHAFHVEVPDARWCAALNTVFGGLPESESQGARYTIALSRSGDNPRFDLTADDEVIASGARGTDVTSTLVQTVNRVAIAAWPHAILHAGGVEREGVGYVFPAEMERGKTTLVTGLVRAGFAYLTDEAVAFEAGSGVIRPYPKPLSIDPGSWPLFPDLAPPGPPDGALTQWQVPPDSIRPGAVGRACPTRVIAFTAYRPGEETRLEPMRRAEALLELTRNTFGFRDHARALLDHLAVVVGGAECYRLTVDRLDHACGLISDLAPATSPP